MSLSYENIHLDSYSGQHNYIAKLYVGQEPVAGVEYVLFDGGLFISDIYVKPEHRRKGYGSRLIKYIQQENPEYKYVPSWKTEDGAKFIHKDLPLKEGFRAREVSEIVEFKRSGETKDSLNVGKYRWMYPPFKKEDILVYQTYLAKIPEEKGWYKFKTKIDSWWPGSDPDTTIYTANSAPDLKTALGYPTFYKEDYDILRYLNNPPLHMQIEKIRLLRDDEINESLEFQRGLNTKSALTIGSRAKRKKIWNDIINSEDTPGEKSFEIGELIIDLMEEEGIKGSLSFLGDSAFDIVTEHGKLDFWYESEGNENGDIYAKKNIDDKFYFLGNYIEDTEKIKKKIKEVYEKI